MKRHRLFTLAAIFFLSVFAHAVDFKANDEVQLTRDEALLFRDQKFREAKAGETFNVLAVRPEQKKVFVAAKDHQGKDIALSVDESALEVVPFDLDKALARITSAVDDSKYLEA